MLLYPPEPGSSLTRTPRRSPKTRAPSRRSNARPPRPTCLASAGKHALGLLQTSTALTHAHTLTSHLDYLHHMGHSILISDFVFSLDFDTTTLMPWSTPASLALGRGSAPPRDAREGGLARRERSFLCNRRRPWVFAINLLTRSDYSLP